MMKSINGEVDPMNHLGETLYCIYCVECMPSIICCRLKHSLVDERTTDICIWGYSVYEGDPGFRTLGQTLSDWRAYHEDHGWDLERWFTKREKALAYLDKILTPSGLAD